jgi:hypothetical protein
MESKQLKCLETQRLASAKEMTALSSGEVVLVPSPTWKHYSLSLANLKANCECRYTKNSVEEHWKKGLRVSDKMMVFL